MRVGQRVRWYWGSGTAEGTTCEVTPDTVTRSLKGAEITRHGSRENPALEIEQEDGDRVLKLASEVEAA